MGDLAIRRSVAFADNIECTCPTGAFEPEMPKSADGPRDWPVCNAHVQLLPIVKY